MITKNFRLSALANRYAANLYDNVRQSSGGDSFMLDAGGEPVLVQILDGVKGMRDLIDGYLLEALKLSYPQWEKIGVALLEKCVDSTGITPYGLSIWDSMKGDMGATVARSGGHDNA
ncbi:Uncharacterised protein [Cedecea lapagei]|uniref:Prophage protein n=1 Tax=Cedecea lapagei TaxID=158823 RepID=A0A3S4MJ10_9ENTR|nr:hypothetical protein [Cedecea lapagei]VEC02014.1 Uncharacterised protein [Cedecea lapagei]